MSNHSKYYGKGKFVVMMLEESSVVGQIQFANHKSDRYEVMWKKPGGERWMQLHSRMALKPYLGK